MTYRKQDRQRWEGIPGRPVMSEAEWLAICQSVATARESSTHIAHSLLEKRIQKIERAASEEFKARLNRTPTAMERRAIPESWLTLDLSGRQEKMRERIRDSEQRRLVEQNALLSGLQLAWRRDLKSQKAQEIIAAAAAANDFEFFVRLGKCLDLSALRPEDLTLSKLSKLLLRDWLSRALRRPGNSRCLLPHYPLVPARIGLCFFTDPALADYCRITLENSDLSDDAVIKCKSRLWKLKPAKDKLIWGVREVAGTLRYR